MRKNKRFMHLILVILGTTYVSAFFFLSCDKSKRVIKIIINYVKPYAWDTLCNFSFFRQKTFGIFHQEPIIHQKYPILSRFMPAKYSKYYILRRYTRIVIAIQLLYRSNVKNDSVTIQI